MKSTDPLPPVASDAHPHAQGHVAFSDIVVAVENARDSRLVLDAARNLSQRSGVMVELVTVNSPGASVQRDRDELAAMARGASLDDAVVRLVVLHSDDVAEVLSSHLASLANPLLCLGSHGRGRFAALLLGSDSEALVRSSGRPVLLAGPRARAITSLSKTLLMCLDGSPASEHVLPVALSWSTSFGGDVLVVCHVDDEDATIADAAAARTQLAEMVRWLRARGAAAESELIEGRGPVDAIATAARRFGVAAVAMTTHGRSPLRRFELGSVALEVVRTISRPVLLLRPGG